MPHPSTVPYSSKLSLSRLCPIENRGCDCFESSNIFHKSLQWEFVPLARIQVQHDRIHPRNFCVTPLIVVCVQTTVAGSYKRLNNSPSDPRCVRTKKRATVTPSRSYGTDEDDPGLRLGFVDGCLCSSQIIQWSAGWLFLSCVSFGRVESLRGSESRGAEGHGVVLQARNEKRKVCTHSFHFGVPAWSGLVSSQSLKGSTRKLHRPLALKSVEDGVIASMPLHHQVRSSPQESLQQAARHLSHQWSAATPSSSCF